MGEIFDAPGIIVVKVGSSTLVDAQGSPDRDFIAGLCAQVAQLRGEGHGVAVV